MTYRTIREKSFQFTLFQSNRAARIIEDREQTINNCCQKIVVRIGNMNKRRNRPKFAIFGTAAKNVETIVGDPS